MIRRPRPSALRVATDVGDNEAGRVRIANAARKRAHRDGYDLDSRARGFLADMNQIAGAS